MIKYYRKITAVFPKKQLVLLLAFALALLFVALLVFFAFMLSLYFEARTERTQGLIELSQIEKQIRINPNYPNLYLAAAVAAERVGSHDKALLYARQAAKLDPLNAMALKLKQKLEK